MKKLIASILGLMLLFTGSITEASRPIDDMEYLLDMGAYNNHLSNAELNKPLTRGEYALWLVNIMGLVDDGHPTKLFTDVDYSTEQGKAIKIATQNNAINGYANGTFKPNNTLKRGQMINLLQRFYKFQQNGNVKPFKDIHENEMVKNSLILRSKGIALGYASTNTFKPYANLTKRQGIAFLARSDRQYRIELEEINNPELPVKPIEPEQTIPNDLESKYDNVFVLWDKDLPTQFKNCTELRTVYKHGVPYNHPAYANKFDRNNDGWACETF